jgi:single-strand DNA-binding protein
MSARSLNKVMLIGNLTRDPNLRYTPGGTAVCSFGLATNRTWTPSEGGEKQEKVEYHNVVAWSKLADICGQLLHKGDKVYVEGRLQSRDWKGDDGQDRRITEVVIDNMILLRSSQGGAGGSYSNDSYGDDAGGPEETTAAPAANSRKPKKSTADTMSEDAQSAEDVADDVPF